MEWYHIYLITRIHSVLLLLSLVLVISTLGLISAIVYRMLEGELPEFLDKHKWKLSISYVCLLVLSILMPSEKEVAAMYLLPKIVNNQYVQEIPNDLVKLLNVNLKRWISESSSN